MPDRPHPLPVPAFAAFVRAHLSTLARRLEGLSSVWRRRRRTIRKGAIVLLAAAAFCEIAANAFLMSGALGRVLSADPSSLIVDYASGWALIPGRVHARRLRVRSRDSNVEFQLDIDRCVFDVSLTDLARRRFHVTRVDGEGVAFRARRRLAPADATEATIAALPPIDDWERVPLKGPSAPPPDDEHYRLWTVELDQVDARATREIWVDQLRLAGQGRVLGGFYLRPLRWAAVGLAVLELEEGRVTTAGEPIADPVRGRLSVQIDGFDPRSTDGAGVLRKLTAKATADAEIPALGFLQRWLPTHAVKVARGSGSASVVLRIEHGRLTAPARAGVDLRGVRIEVEKGWAEASVHLSASVAAPDGRGGPGAGDGGEPRLEASLETRDVRAGSREPAGTAFRAARAELGLQAGRLDLADRAFSDANVTARVPSLEILDARAAGAWLGLNQVMGGRGTASAEASIAEGVMRGRADLALVGLRVGAGGAQLSGDVDARVNLARWLLRDGTIDVGGSRLDLREVTAGDTRGWWAHADFPSSTLRTRHGVAWRTHVDVSARDARPLVSIAVPDGLPRWAASLFSTDGVRASTDLRVTTSSLALDRVAITAGPFAIAGRYARRGDSDRALFLVEDGALAVGVEKEGGSTHFQLLDPRGWFRQRSEADGDSGEGAQAP